MTNYQLLVIAVISVVAAAFWCAKKTSAAVAPTLLAAIMLFIALGGPIWEWSKWSGGAGLPPLVRAATFGESRAVPAFLWAAIGAAVSSLLIPQAQAWSRPKRNRTLPKNISILAIIVSALSFVCFVIGSGPSFLRREIYGVADGNDLLLRGSWPAGVVFGLVGMTLISFEKDRRLRYCMIGTSLLWFIGSVAVGSRTAMSFPLLAAILIIQHEISQRRIHLPMIGGALILLAATMFTFSVTLQARYMPHGLLNLPNVLNVTTTESLASTDSFLLPLKQFASSVFASVPNAEQSAIYDVDLHVLLANANPMPGTAQPMELERYWPYEWVPLSFAGTWYGATGWAGQFLLFGSIGWVSGYTAYNIQRGGFQVAFAPIGIAALIGVLSIQYSSRMVWRIVSIAVLMLIVSYLVRSRTPKDQRAPNGGVINYAT